MLKNTKNSYGLLSRAFHTIVGIMVICLLIVGFYMTDLPKSLEKFELYGMHKATGVVVLGLVIFRLIWRWMNIAPTLPATVPGWQAFAYNWGVRMMYVFMLGMPIAGVVMSRFSGKDISVYGLFTIKAAAENDTVSYIAWKIHTLGAWVFVAFITVHTLMALYHHFVVKDRLLMRIITGK